MNMQNEITHVTFNINGVDIIQDILHKDGNDLMPIAPICKAIGISEGRQRARLKRSKQFTTDHMVSRGSDGKQRSFLCIPVKQLAMWLCTISSDP